MSRRSYQKRLELLRRAQAQLDLAAFGDATESQRREMRKLAGEIHKETSPEFYRGRRRGAQ